MKIAETDLKRLIKERGLTVETFAEKLGMTRQGVYYLMMRSYVKPAIVDKICTVLSVDKSDFLEPEDDKKNVARETKESYGNIVFVPVFAYAGFLTGYKNSVFMNSLDRFRLPGVTGEHYAFEISGMSMYKVGDEKSASPGDIAISRPVEEFRHMLKGKGYILQTIDGIVYKEFDAIKGDFAQFHSINSEYDGLELPLKDIKRAYFVDFILKKTY